MCSVVGVRIREGVNESRSSSENTNIYEKKMKNKRYR